MRSSIAGALRARGAGRGGLVPGGAASGVALALVWLRGGRTAAPPSLSLCMQRNGATEGRRGRFAELTPRRFRHVAARDWFPFALHNRFDTRRFEPGCHCENERAAVVAGARHPKCEQTRKAARGDNLVTTYPRLLRR